MSRAVPPSPDLLRAQLDARLDSVPAPVMPADLAARIKREVPRMAQLPPLIEAAPAPPPVAEPADVRAEVIPLAPRRTRRWMAWSAAGLGAMAAGLAALAVVGTGQQPVTASLQPAGAPATPLASAAPLPAPTEAARPQAQLAQAIPAGAVAKPAAARTAASPTPAAQPSPAAPAEAAPLATAPTTAMAVATPPKVEAGPQEGPEGAVPPSLGTRGQMGPVLPQGYGYTGGTGGPAVPSGAPVRMSGGPGPGPGGPP